MNHLQNKMRGKANGLRQFSNRDVNNALPGLHPNILSLGVAGGPGPQVQDATDANGDENRVSFPRNLRAILEEFVPISFIQASKFRIRFHLGNGWSRGHSEEVHHMKRTVLKFLNDESGATAIEYGLIAAGIALAIIAVVNGLGSTLNNKFTSVNSSLK
jgi:pilus assembly protein Flp/PilA